MTLLLPPPPPPDTRLMSDPLLLEVAVGGGGLLVVEFPPPLFLRRRIILRLELKLMLLMDLDQFLLRAKPCLADIFGVFYRLRIVCMKHFDKFTSGGETCINYFLDVGILLQ